MRLHKTPSCTDMQEKLSTIFARHSAESVPTCKKMSCAPHNCIPSAINGGETLTLTLSDGCHPANLWTMALVLNNGIVAPTSVAATTNTDGRSFDVTLTATVTAALAIGPTTVIPLYTKIADTTVKEYGHASSTTVIPAITATATPSFAQSQVTRLQGALAALSASKFSSAEFNGQTYTKVDASKYRVELTFWMAQVIEGQKAILAARGGCVNDGRIQTEFAPVAGYNYPPFGFPFYNP